MSSLMREKTFSIPEWLMAVSLEEVKRHLCQGDLLPSLQDHFMGCNEGNRLTRITLKKEEYQHEYAFLTLSLEFRSPAARIPHEEECILQYRCDEFGACHRAIRSWYYPEDPYIPALTHLFSSPTFLKEILWERPSANLPLHGEDLFIRRLHYNPGRRATFLLASSEMEKKLVLKMVRPADFREFLAKAQMIRDSSLGDRIVVTQLISYSAQEHLFLYDYVPGLQIKRLEAEELKGIKSFLFEEVAQMLCEIHRMTLPLPRWDPIKTEGERMQGYLRPLRICLPNGAAAFQPLVDRIFRYLAQKDRGFSGMIHNTFSGKHIIYLPDGSDPPIPGRLGIIDLDSAVLGPREKDIGLFLFGFSKCREDSLFFLDRYQKKSGYTLDLDLVNVFIQYQRLLRAFQKALSNSGEEQTYAAAIEKIEKQIDHNPLKA